MSGKPVEVLCYSGHRADVEPRVVVVDGQRLEVAAITRRWREPDARLFVVRIAGGTRYVLRQEMTTSAWTMAKVETDQR